MQNDYEEYAEMMDLHKRNLEERIIALYREANEPSFQTSESTIHCDERGDRYVTHGEPGGERIYFEDEEDDDYGQKYDD